MSEPTQGENNMKKSVFIIPLAVILLAGCSSGSTAAKSSSSSSSSSAAASSTSKQPDVEVKTGIEDNKQWGTYIANLVYSDNKLIAVDLDLVDAKGNSGKEKYNSYGIKKVSSIGKEWWEQVEDYEKYLVDNDGKTAQTDKDGHATDKALLSGATISLADFSTAISNAEKGVPAKTDQTTVKTGWKYSPEWGTYLANIVERDGKPVKVLVDRIDKDGSIAREKYDNYGIKKVSTINKDWWEQAEAYEEYVLKNGADSVKYDKDGHATDPDLLSGATIDISDFNDAVKQAESK